MIQEKCNIFRCWCWGVFLYQRFFSEGRKKSSSAGTSPQEKTKQKRREKDKEKDRKQPTATENTGMDDDRLGFEATRWKKSIANWQKIENEHEKKSPTSSTHRKNPKVTQKTPNTPPDTEKLFNRKNSHSNTPWIYSTNIILHEHQYNIRLLWPLVKAFLSNR